jgi:phage protein D
LKIQDETLVIYDEADLETTAPNFSLSKYDLSGRYTFRTQAHDIYKEAKVMFFDPKKKKTTTATVGSQQIIKSADSSKKILQDIYGATADSKKSPSKKPSTNKPHYATHSYLNEDKFKGGKVLIIRQKVHSIAEAERLAKSKLREKNKGEWVAEFNAFGNVNLVAGINVQFNDFGKFGGVFMIDETTHKVSKANGYTTSIKAHRVLVKA